MERSSRSLAETYDSIAQQWDDAHANELWWVPGAERFLQLVPAGPLLDVGCGCGYEARFYADHAREVVGIDISAEQIRLAQKRVPEGEFYQMDLFDLPKLNRKFSGVQAQAALLHVPKARWPEALAALRSVLVPGGWLYISVKERYPEQPEEEVKVEQRYNQQIERFFSYFTPGEPEAAVVRAGLVNVETTASQAPETTWLQVFGQEPS